MPTLVFQIGQGGSNSVDFAGDMLAIQRMAAAVQPLRSRYDVVFEITPTCQWPKVIAALDQCAGAQVPYCLTGASSDTNATGMGDFKCPYDLAHGIAQPEQRMYELWARHGGTFRGFRFHEVCTTAWAATAHADWWKKLYPPPDGFCQLKILEPFVAFAHGHGQALMWSDAYWQFGHPLDDQQKAREQMIRDLTNAYPNTIVPMYADNLWPSIDSYQSVSPVFTPKTRARGLSMQTYAADPAGIPARAQAAVRQGWTYLEFEPVSAWFFLPSLAFTSAADANYIHDPAWADRGSPLPAFKALAAALMSA